MSLGLVNNKKNTDGDNVSFRDNVRWIRVTQFGEYSYKESFSETEAWKTVTIKRRNDDQSHEVPDPALRTIPKAGIPIKKYRY